MPHWLETRLDANDAAGAPGRRPRAAWLQAGLTVAVALVAVGSVQGSAAGAGLSVLAGTSASTDCNEATVTATVTADAWVDENSPRTTKGSDSILSVDGGSPNVDTGLPSGRARALVRFQLPPAIPEGCVLESARLELFSSEESAGAKAEVARLASAWSESGVSWSNHPQAIGDGVTSWSRSGYMQWRVTAQVEAMLEAGNHGFLIRDAAEGSEAGGGHSFYSREKGENPARLVIRFAPPPSDEQPGPPAPPEPATVACGQTLTESTLVTNDLLGCPGDGLVIDAPRIILDLGGHTIDGVGLGSGVRNEGHASVTVRNGIVQEFDYGVNLLPETQLNLVESLTLRRNEVGAVELFDVAETEVRGNVLDENGGGISLVSGTSNAVVAGNTVTANGKAGLFVRDSDGNRLEDNSVSGGGDLGIGLERATGNTLVRNAVSGNSDGGIELSAGSHRNRVEHNTVASSGDHGIRVDLSDGNELFSNTSHFMSDSGIALESANDSVVRGNDVRFNTGGLQIDGSSRNEIVANDASATSGIGIELGGGSLQNALLRNVANGNGSTGIVIADDAADPLGFPVLGLGNLLVGNVADRNRADGILVAKGGHTITANAARGNAAWGVEAALNSIDGGLNVASGNLKPEDCVGVVCKLEWNSPETTITERPPDATSGTSASFRFTGSDDTTSASELRFECRLDTPHASGWAACSSPRDYSGLPPGSHVFEVRAVDRADNRDPSPAVHFWVVGAGATQPETTIQSGPAAETASTVASFVFSADEPGATFACSLDGGPFEACASPTLYPLVTEGRHDFQVFATDAAGNSDATPATHTWTVDVTPPETTLEVAPAELTNRTSATLAFSADEDAVGFACSLDGAPFHPCETPVEYSGLVDGAHTFEVRASDRLDNADATPARHDWTVDTVAPETTIDSGPAPLTDSAPATFAFSSEPAARLECRLDGRDWDSCSSPHEYGALADGAHTFDVRATDAAGNADASPASHSWTVDTLAPETSIDAAPADPSNDPSPRVAFASEPGATFECRLDNGDWERCASPQGYSVLANGEHEFHVRATDAAGNVDRSPASHAWTIDTIAPETTIDTGPPATTQSTSASFTLSASEAGSTFECSLDDDPFAACTSPVEYSGLTPGAHRFRAQARDEAGNLEPEAASHEWTILVSATQPPDTAIGGGPTDPTDDASARLSFTGSDDDTPAAALRFECRLDGDMPDGFVSCSSPHTYSDLADGRHIFEVRAIDQNGQVDPTPASHGWRVDTTAPETTIDSGPPALTTSTGASFSFSANEPDSSFQCSLDGATYTACSSPKSSSGLAAGPHTFQVRATDRAGNSDPSPASHSWTIIVPKGCAPSTITVRAEADSWVLQSSPNDNYARDSVVKVDTKAGGNARALVRFALPPIPAGCDLSDARLRLHASSSKTGRTLEALRLAGGWTETGVTWNNQPATSGVATQVASGAGYREWIAVSQVQAMYASGNHGFLIRDASEGGAGWEQGFHSREKGTDEPPTLVLTFGLSTQGAAMRYLSSWADRRFILGVQDGARKLPQL